MRAAKGGGIRTEIHERIPDTKGGADHRLCVAPMMDCTDRHDRYLLRMVSRHVRLYTEMVATGALRYGPRERFLAHDPIEHPVALQLGGSDPGEMAQCARLAARAGFDEVNMNVGCPSPRVSSGRFGACLMAEPQRVAACVAAMRDAVSIPVTVKTRLGIDDLDSDAHLDEFVYRVAQAGCDTFIVHARKAWLQGVSPRQNRELPPLRYDRVYRLKREFPGLRIVLNGGVRSLASAHDHLAHVDGVMIGREAYHNPYMLAAADRRFFESAAPVRLRAEVLADYVAYVERQLALGVHLKHMARHALGLFQGMPGAKAWRRTISTLAYRPEAGADVLHAAARHVLAARPPRERVPGSIVAEPMFV